MTLNELLEIVHQAYPDELTRECWNPVLQRACGGGGDTLAEFIVREIVETYDSDSSTGAQLAEAIRVLNRAIGDLGGVARALEVRSALIAIREPTNAHAQGN